MIRENMYKRAFDSVLILQKTIVKNSYFSRIIPKNPAILARKASKDCRKSQYFISVFSQEETVSLLEIKIPILQSQNPSNEYEHPTFSCRDLILKANLCAFIWQKSPLYQRQQSGQHR